VRLNISLATIYYYGVHCSWYVTVLSACNELVWKTYLYGRKWSELVCKSTQLVSKTYSYWEKCSELVWKIWKILTLVSNTTGIEKCHCIAIARRPGISCIIVYFHCRATHVIIFLTCPWASMLRYSEFSLHVCRSNTLFYVFYTMYGLRKYRAIIYSLSPVYHWDRFKMSNTLYIIRKNKRCDFIIRD